MSKVRWIVVAAFAVCFAGMAWAAGPYQVTGPVVELTDSKIVIDKKDGKWEIARTPETKVTGELKVGEKVTVEYRMTAVGITAKGAAAVEKPAAKTSEKKAEKPAEKK